MTDLVRDIEEGLAWTGEGCVGVWRVGGVDSLGLADTDHTVAMWERVSAGISQLARHATLHGVTHPLVGERLAAAISGTGASIEAERAGIAVAAVGKWERSVYLSVPLEEASALQIATDRIRTRFGLGRSPAQERSRAKLRHQRDVLAARAGDLGLTAATVAEITWLFSRVAGVDQPGRRGGGPFGVRLREGFGEQGGSRRWVAADDGHTVVYHSILAIEHMSEWMFPGGGEWWRSCDMLAFPVEWSVRLNLVPNHEARSQLRRRLSELDYQDEKETEYDTAPPRELVASIETVEDAISQLTEHSHIPLAQPTLLFWVSADTLEELDYRAETLRSLFEGADMAMVRPLGAQRRLLQAMVPGAPLPLQGRGWEQLILPRDLASGLPVVASEVGDQTGGFLGWQLLSGTVPVPVSDDDTATEREGWTCRAVFFDAAAGPAKNRTGAAGFIGDQGAGKSMTTKKLARDVVDRGGRVVVYDPTEAGEWARWAHAVSPNPLVITLDGDTAYDLDPLRTFTERASAERYGLGLLSLLTGTPATGADASVLRAAVAAVQDEHGGLSDVPEALRAGGGKPGGRLADDIDTVLNTAMGRALLSGTGRPVDPDEQVTVFRLPSLALPSSDELATEWGRRHLLPEQIMGQGVVYLIAAVARELTMTSDVFGLGILEEAYHIVRSSPQGRTLVLGWVRDSRKHNASVWLVSQSIHDTDEELRSLLRNRLVFRQGQGLGAAALEWLGLPASGEFVNLVERELVPGECLYQDMGGRIGLVRVTAPADAALAAAFSTTPVTVP